LFEETQRLLKETEQRAAELSIINSVQAGLATKLEIESIYELVGEKISEIFESDTMYVAIFDHATGMDQIVYGIEEGEGFYSKPEPFTKFEKHIIQSRQTEVITENNKDRFTELGMEIIDGTKSPESGMWVPLLIGNEVRGMISLQSNTRDHAFTPSSVRLLETLANSMSVALENARLFDETQRLLKETEQRAAELQIINSIQAGLATKLDIQSIYELVGEKIRSIFDAEITIMSIFDTVNDLDNMVYGFENGERLIYGTTPLSNFQRYLIRTQKTEVINDHALQRFPELGMELVPGTEPPKSGAWVPLVVGKQVRGLISLQNLSRENAFSASDIRLLETLANSMSVALENARLFDETQRLLKRNRTARC
jgi:GAF domain-containing protein